MSYQKAPQEPYPPPGYASPYPPPPPPPGYPSAPPYEGYPPAAPPPPGYPGYPPPLPQHPPYEGYQGYFGQGYTPPPPPPAPQYQHYHHHYEDQTGCASFLQGWYARYPSFHSLYLLHFIHLTWNLSNFIEDNVNFPPCLTEYYRTW